MSEGLLHCADCHWTGLFREAISHYRVTRHQILGHAGPQDFSGWISRCKQCHAEMAVSPGLSGWPERTVCDPCVFQTVKREWSKSA